METDQIIVTEDGHGIVGWLDGTTAARIIWKEEDHPEWVHGREVHQEGEALAVLFALDRSRYQLESARLVPTVTAEDLMAAIAPGNRDMVLIEAKIDTKLCTCADEMLYTVTANSPNGANVTRPLASDRFPSVVNFWRERDPSVEISVEQQPNPDYRPDCPRKILEDELYVKYLGAGGDSRYDKVYCQHCAIALWGDS